MDVCTAWELSAAPSKSPMAHACVLAAERWQVSMPEILHGFIMVLTYFCPPKLCKLVSFSFHRNVPEGSMFGSPAECRVQRLMWPGHSSDTQNIHHCLVVWASPLKNTKVSWGDEIPNALSSSKQVQRILSSSLLKPHLLQGLKLHCEPFGYPTWSPVKDVTYGTFWIVLVFLKWLDPIIQPKSWRTLVRWFLLANLGKMHG